MRGPIQHVHRLLHCILHCLLHCLVRLRVPTNRSGLGPGATSNPTLHLLSALPSDCCQSPQMHTADLTHISPPEHALRTLLENYTSAARMQKQKRVSNAARAMSESSKLKTQDARHLADSGTSGGERGGGECADSTTHFLYPAATPMCIKRKALESKEVETTVLPRAC